MSEKFDALKDRTMKSVMNTYGRYPLALKRMEIAIAQARKDRKKK